MISYLIDTHILIFYFTDKSKLTKWQIDTIESSDTEIYVSTISYFEMATLIRLKKIDLGMNLHEFYLIQQKHGFKDLDFGMIELEMVSKIVPVKNHKDPVDFMLICQ
ncbi:MAG: PIN domain-containing protein [Bacteroidetes bacterium]|nr:MAG: PIN domain-containing protein [Bacteroidota bacterium]